MQFVMERACTEAEIDHLEGLAKCLLTDEGRATYAAQHGVQVYKGSRTPYIGAMERLVKATADQPDTWVSVWPRYVRYYLRTEGWELGLGGVGTVNS